MRNAFSVLEVGTGGTVPYEALGLGVPVCVCDSAGSRAALDFLVGVLPAPTPRYDSDAMAKAVEEILRLKKEGGLDPKVLVKAMTGNDAKTCVDRMLGVASAGITERLRR